MGAGQFILPVIQAHRQLEHRSVTDGLLALNNPKSIITLWSLGHDWRKYGSDPNTTVADDATTFRTGSQGLRLTDTNSANRYVAVSKEINLDARKNILLDVYVEDYTKIDKLSIFLSPVINDLTISFTCDYPGSNLRNGWNTIEVSGYSLYKLNVTDDDLTRIKYVRIKMLRTESALGASIVLDRLYTTPISLSKGKVTISFDDSLATTYTVAKPMMDAYGMSGVVYAIPELVGTAGYMTVGQMKTLQDLGWDICSHTMSHLYMVGDPQPTEAEIRAELLDSKQWLIANGFARGSQHFASPGGQHTNEIIDIIKEYYVTHRTILGSYQNPYPTINPYKLRVGLIINTTTIAQIKASIDSAANQKTWYILCIHDIVDPADVATKILPATFQEIINYLAAANVDVVTMSDMIQENGVGLDGYNNYVLTDTTTTALSRLTVANGVVGAETL